MSKILYSVLMSAEILACDTDKLLFGSDQMPNFKITKKIINRINNRFQNINFKIPEVDFMEVL